MINEKTIHSHDFQQRASSPDKALLRMQLELSEKIGYEFFNLTVERIAKLVNADYTLIGNVNKTRTEVSTIAAYDRNGLMEPFAYPLEGTPCATLSSVKSCVYQEGVAAQFPDDNLLVEMRIEGYVGIALVNAANVPIGVVVGLFKSPVQDPDFVSLAFEVLSTRIKAELERLFMEQRMKEQQERLEFALRAGDLGVYDWNIYNGDLIFNARLFEIIGFTPAEFQPTYLKWVSLVHPDDYDKLAIQLARKIEDEKEYFGPTRYRIQTKSGNYKWVEIQSYSFYSDAAKLYRRNVGIIKDVDEEVKREEELNLSYDLQERLYQRIKQREEWYAFALKVGSLGVYDWYVEQDHCIFSARLCEMIGMPGEQITISSEKWLSLIHPSDRWQFDWRSFKERIANNKAMDYTYRMMTKEGQYRWIESSNMAVEFNDKGHITRIIGIIKDIQDAKDAEARLVESLQKQTELNETLTVTQDKLITQMRALQSLNKDLRESKLRWAYALEGNGDGVCEFNIATGEWYFSERAREILGFNKEESFAFTDALHDESLSEFQSLLTIALHAPFEPLRVELQLRDNRNNLRWVLLRGKVVEVADDDTPLRMVGTVTDLSQDKLFKKELTIYEEMIKQNHSMILFTSVDGTIEFVNKTALDSLEYKQHEIIGKDIRTVLPKLGLKGVLEDKFHSKLSVMSKSGREFVTQAATSLIWHEGDPIGFVFNIIDMTEKARLENEINLLTLSKLEAQLEAQRRQTEISIQVQENEKESIARELHDGVGQLLSLAKLQLEEISAGLSPELQQQGKNVRELVQHITTDIKSLTRDLMPLSVRNLGLEAALSGLLERYHSLKDKEITCKIHLDGYEPDQRNAIHIYRIAQEAINNAIKYSGATSISLMCMKLKGSINLIVEDNGKGFDLSVQMKKQNSFGLKTMHERARLLKGKLLINAAENSGTTISLTIPLS
ncbi:PAS domain-containing protein [Pseudochryseolinea flava]|uniref:histidine kinase n=1 Tax=Pseudochryseolinea flava TaxID=2059302 RepID=A0A364Y308_9BACT|nr:PAS domain-containing protein [Pseudochryseolinea flava]RAW00526.1 hypothetical protein DQQ10_13075 [Pseudochryseolinea flava]